MNKNALKTQASVNTHYFLKRCLTITNATIKGLEMWLVTLETWLEADEVTEIEFEVAFIRMCRCGGVELTDNWWKDLYRAITGKAIDTLWLHNVALLFLPKWVDEAIQNEMNHSINQELSSK